MKVDLKKYLELTCATCKKLAERSSHDFHFISLYKKCERCLYKEAMSE